MAIIFQSYGLIDYLTPTENAALTSRLPPLPILEQLGLTVEEAKRNVLKLSGSRQHVGGPGWTDRRSYERSINHWVYTA